MKSDICMNCADKSCYGYDRTVTECEDFQPMTNYDRLISKTPEEMAKYIACVLQYREGDVCPPTHKCAVDKSCEKCWLDWLKSPENVEEQT